MSYLNCCICGSTEDEQVMHCKPEGNICTGCYPDWLEAADHPDPMWIYNEDEEWWDKKDKRTRYSPTEDRSHGCAFNLNKGGET